MKVRILLVDDDGDSAGCLVELASSEPPNELLSLAEVERRHVLAILDAVGGNKSEAARILGVDRKTLQARLQRYGRM